MLQVKRTFKYCLFLLIMILMLVLGFFYSNTRLTYIEYSNISTNIDKTIPIETVGTELTQSFNMPYSILDSIAIRIGTYGQDNNSIWLFSFMILMEI